MSDEAERRLLRAGGLDLPGAPTSVDEQRRVVSLLGERVKELTALHEVARLLSRGTAPIQETLSAFVALIPPAFQFPELTAARAQYAGLRAVTPNFDEKAPRLSACHSSGSGIELRLDVAYLGDGAGEAFLPEELTLVESMVELVGGAIDRHSAQERLELAVAGTGAGVWEWDLASGAVIWSEEMEAMAGLAPGSFPGTVEAFRALAYPGDSERLRAETQRAFDAGKSRYAAEFRLRRPNGEVRWIAVRGRIFRHANGLPYRVLGLGLDITERRALEDQLRQAQKMEAVGSLAAGIAHDFNNMLSVVLSYADIALLELEPGAPLREEMEEIRRAAVRAGELTRHLLAFSRQQLLEPRVLHLNETLTGLKRMLPRLLSKAIEFRLTLAPTLGTVSADPGQLEQVIINLVVNARDAMPTGGVLSIETADSQLDEAYAAAHVDVVPGHYVMLAVTDSGVGMTPEVRARIFDPFFTTKGVGKGTGLGLASVFGFVRQSGGHIAVDSEPGLGSSFKLYLPRTDRPAEGPRESHAAPEVLEGIETVLLVEDDDSVRALARAILRRGGYAVLEAKSTDGAILLCEKHAPRLHLLLTDTVMPVMSGPDLAIRLTAIAPNLKVLHMSGYTDAVVAHKMLERGIAFIQKPLTLRGLLLKVREVLDA